FAKRRKQAATSPQTLSKALGFQGDQIHDGASRTNPLTAGPGDSRRGYLSAATCPDQSGIFTRRRDCRAVYAGSDALDTRVPNARRIRRSLFAIYHWA